MKCSFVGGEDPIAWKKVSASDKNGKTYFKDIEISVGIDICEKILENGKCIICGSKFFDIDQFSNRPFFKELFPRKKDFLKHFIEFGGFKYTRSLWRDIREYNKKVIRNNQIEVVNKHAGLFFLLTCQHPSENGDTPLITKSSFERSCCEIVEFNTSLRFIMNNKCYLCDTNLPIGEKCLEVHVCGKRHIENFGKQESQNILLGYNETPPELGKIDPSWFGGLRSGFLDNCTKPTISNKYFDGSTTRTDNRLKKNEPVSQNREKEEVEEEDESQDSSLEEEKEIPNDIFLWKNHILTIFSRFDKNGSGLTEREIRSLIFQNSYNRNQTRYNNAKVNERVQAVCFKYYPQIFKKDSKTGKLRVSEKHTKVKYFPNGEYPKHDLSINKISASSIRRRTKIPLNGPWKCEDCEMTTNLWMNLEDGFIGCGRSYRDVSLEKYSGNGHALKHYERTKSCPLVIKLGTITPQHADIHSYRITQNVCVDRSKVDHCLSLFGLDRRKMRKSDLTLEEIRERVRVAHEKDFRHRQLRYEKEQEQIRLQLAKPSANKLRKLRERIQQQPKQQKNEDDGHSRKLLKEMQMLKMRYKWSLHEFRIEQQKLKNLKEKKEKREQRYREFKRQTETEMREQAKQIRLLTNQVKNLTIKNQNIEKQSQSSSSTQQQQNIKKNSYFEERKKMEMERKKHHEERNNMSNEIRRLGIMMSNNEKESQNFLKAIRESHQMYNNKREKELSDARLQMKKLKETNRRLQDPFVVYDSQGQIDISKIEDESELQNMMEKNRNVLDNFRKMFEEQQMKILLREAELNVSSRKCQICMEDDVDIALNCGHTCCDSCSGKVSDCPFCRKSIKTRLKIFI